MPLNLIGDALLLNEACPLKLSGRVCSKKGGRKLLLFWMERFVGLDELAEFFGNGCWAEAAVEELQAVMAYLAAVDSVGGGVDADCGVEQAGFATEQDGYVEEIYRSLPLEKIPVEDLARSGRSSAASNEEGEMKTALRGSGSSARRAASSLLPLRRARFLIQQLNRSGNAKQRRHALRLILQSAKQRGEPNDDVCQLWQLGNWSMCSDREIAEEALELLHSFHPKADYSSASTALDELFRALPWPALRDSVEKLEDASSPLLIKIECLQRVAQQRGGHAHFKVLLHFCESVWGRGDAGLAPLDEEDLLFQAWTMLDWRPVAHDRLASWVYPAALAFLEKKSIPKCPNWSRLLCCLDLNVIPMTWLATCCASVSDLGKAGLHLDALHSVTLTRMEHDGLDEQMFASAAETCQPLGSTTTTSSSWDHISSPNLHKALDLLLHARVEGVERDIYVEHDADPSEDAVTRIASRLPFERLETATLLTPASCAKGFPVYALLQRVNSRAIFEEKCVPLFFAHCNCWLAELQSDNRRLENLLHTFLHKYHRLVAEERAEEQGGLLGDCGVGGTIVEDPAVAALPVPTPLVAGTVAPSRNGSGVVSPSKEVLDVAEESVVETEGATPRIGQMLQAASTIFGSSEQLLHSSSSVGFNPTPVLTLGNIPEVFVLPFSKHETARIFSLLDSCDMTRDQILPILDFLDLCYLPRALYSRGWVGSCCSVSSRSSWERTGSFQINMSVVG